MWLCSRGSWAESGEKTSFKELRARSGVNKDGSDGSAACHKTAVETQISRLPCSHAEPESAESGSESAFDDKQVCSHQPNRNGMTVNNL